MHLLPTKVGVGVVAAALVASAVPAHASSLPCFDETDMQSARIHDLRVMLMVNALKCRTLSPTTLRNYGALLDQRSDELQHHGKQVKTALISRYGERQGQFAFNDYETRIGNYHSGVRATGEQCDNVDAFIKLASRADHAELEMLSKLATNRKIDTCVVPESASFVEPVSADWSEPIAPPAPAATAIPDVAQVAEATEMVDGIPTYSTPGTGPDTMPEPLEAVVIAPLEEPATTAEPASVAAVEDDTPTPSPRDAKLTQAIDALDAAAAALRDMQSSADSTIR